MASLDLPFDPNFALDRYLSSVDTEEDMESPSEMEEFTCMELIKKSMHELLDRGEVISLATLMHRMAFEHAFDAVTNLKLIQRSVRILRLKGIVKKRGPWYKLVTDPEEGKVGGKSLNKSKEDNVANSKQSMELTCKKLILQSLKELENKGVHFQKLTHHMAFEHGFNIIANDNLIKNTLKEIQIEGAITKNGFSYKLSKKQQNISSKEKKTANKSNSCGSLILKSIKELDSFGKGVSFTQFTHHMAFEHSYNVQENGHLIKGELKALLNKGLVTKRGFRYNVFKESKDIKPKAKLSKSKLRNSIKSRDSPNTNLSTKTMRELNNDIKGISLWRPWVSDHALRSRSHLGLANNSRIIKRTSKLIQEKRRNAENEAIQKQKTTKATVKPSPQKAVQKKPAAITTSLFSLLPPEMGLKIIKRLDLNDLDALFTAFDDLQAKYLPFLKSLSYSDDPEPPSEKAFPCGQSCNLVTYGIFGVKYVFLENRHLFRYLLRNKVVKSLTIRDAGGLQGACTRKSEVNLTGSRSFHLGIETLKIVNAELSIPR